MKIATDINGDIQQPKEPIESAAEVVDEMDPSITAAITAADARLLQRLHENSNWHEWRHPATGQACFN